MSTLRAAVIGTGHLGQHHARVYADLDGVELVGVVDPDEKQGKKVAGRQRCPWSAGYEGLLPDLDLASIAAPTAHHFRIAKDFLAAGVAVLVEKPMTTTLEEAQELVRCAEAANVPVQVGHIERFNPAFVEIQEILDRPAYIEADRISPFSFRSTDIGVVLDLMIHDIDIILYLMQSEVERVDAVGINVLGRNEDVANVRLTFANGCVANLTASRASMKSERKIRIFQEDAYVSLDYQKREAKIYRKTEKMKKMEVDPTAIDPRKLANPLAFVFGNLIHVQDVKMGKEEPLAEEIGSFVESVRNQTPTAVTARDGLRAIEVADRIRRAMEESAQRVREGRS